MVTGSRIFRIWSSLLFCLAACFTAPAQEPPEYQLGPDTSAGQPWQTRSLRSVYQRTDTKLYVLLPTKLEAGKRYPVLYLLPVEAQGEHRYGSGIEEASRARLADRLQVICVEPTFAQLPWYADHPTDAGVRQESHLLRAVVPAVDAHYPTPATAAGRWLVGFSKSGWGAVTLLRRHPEVFSRAGAWDAPLQMNWPTKYGSQPIFGTRENFEPYRVSTLLSTSRPEHASQRLVLAGHGNFRAEMAATHQQLQHQSPPVPHVFLDGPDRPHDWHSGWLADVSEALAKP